KWQFTTGGHIRSATAISSDGTLYIGSYDHILYALNPNGTVKWTYHAGTAEYEPSPAIGPDGTIYTGVNDFTFHAIAGDKPLSSAACPKFRCDLHNTGRPQW
ncbi:MAG: PQQ-like beta-propeller repeat protein, partial [Elusimicrobia bacterium]|nr:PQQ-like beta-propeller repeat protein [Elusimicrobiota bacterium]